MDIRHVLIQQQSRLDMTELLWKAYIDFEVAQEESELARQLYERLLERTHHVKVWISYAKFELTPQLAEEDDDMNIRLARRVYERANDTLRQLCDKESKVLLLEAWCDFERESGDQESLGNVMEKMPRRVKTRQKLISESVVEERCEEVFDYKFPEDEMARPNLKLLAAIKMWKKLKDNSDNVTENQTNVKMNCDGNAKSGYEDVHKEPENVTYSSPNRMSLQSASSKQDTKDRNDNSPNAL